ncbi:MAG: COX15/CtaA family protein [Chthoniobacter sp.]|nr:COX15/CtaA family protein [Chthoniobacter sp.]
MKATTTFNPALALYAKGVVAATFALIFIGGLVTSHQAGMAVPDWPLSFGSLNPEGWWGELPVRLEHGHRLFATGVGALVTILCAWVWRNGWPLLIALLASGTLTPAAKFLGIAPIVVMHVGIWSFAGVFAIALLWLAKDRAPADSRAVRWVVFAAFIGVALQATFGGLRVTMETANHLRAALILRIVHGCVAQAELCLLVAVAALLSRRWVEDAWQLAGTSLKAVRRLAWLVVLAVYGQLILGATLRHLGAGLAIPTFPEANPDGGFMPKVHNMFVDLHFTHSRAGALVITLLVLTLVLLVLRRARGEVLLTSPATGLLGLVFIQVSLGMAVILNLKPITLTTLHVVNGAAVLALSLLLALRAGRFTDGAGEARA